MGASIVYYRHLGGSLDYWVPQLASSYANFSNTGTSATYTTKGDVCPAKALKIDNPYTAVSLSSLISAKSVQLNSSKLILNIWVDGGNTEGLRQEVKYAYPWETYQLYADLINSSPYLSDDVLIDAINSEIVLPLELIKTVLIANPQSVRSDRVIDALNNRFNPLPEDMIEEIMQGLDVISPRDNLEANVSYYAAERKTYLDLLKIYYMAENTDNGLGNLIELLNNETDIDSRYDLVFAKINNQDFVGARASLDTISTMFNHETQTNEWDRYTKMQGIIPILIDMQSGNSWLNLSDTARSLLVSLSESDEGFPGSIARSARLRFDNTFVYKEPIYDNETVRKPIIKRKAKVLVKESKLTINPNPADEYIAVSYDLNTTIKGLRLVITDALGKLVYEKNLFNLKGQELLKINDYAKGNYICTLFNNGKPIENCKFIKK